MKKKIILVFILISLSSCRWFSGEATNRFYKGFKITPPPGSRNFQKGFLDGCHQILYARGNFFYSTIYKYHYDTSLNYDKEYRFGYKRGNFTCFQQVVGGNAVRSFDSALFQNGQNYVSESANYNDTGLFGGINSTFTGGDVNGIFEVWGSGGSVLDGNPLWAGGSKGQIFGQ